LDCGAGDLPANEERLLFQTAPIPESGARMNSPQPEGNDYGVSF
jgi:hypothetical protein